MWFGVKGKKLPLRVELEFGGKTRGSKRDSSATRPGALKPRGRKDRVAPVGMTMFGWAERRRETQRAAYCGPEGAALQDKKLKMAA